MINSTMLSTRGLVVLLATVATVHGKLVILQTALCSGQGQCVTIIILAEVCNVAVCGIIEIWAV